MPRASRVWPYIALAPLIRLFCRLFQYTHFTSSHPPGVKKGFIKGEALRLLRTNSSKKIFEEKIKVFKSHLLERGYPEKLIQTTLLEVKFEDRNLACRTGGLTGPARYKATRAKREARKIRL